VFGARVEGLVAVVRGDRLNRHPAGRVAVARRRDHHGLAFQFCGDVRGRDKHGARLFDPGDVLGGIVVRVPWVMSTTDAFGEPGRQFHGSM